MKLSAVLDRIDATLPEATLCFAKATADEVSFEDIDILLGVRFCMERADADKGDDDVDRLAQNACWALVTSTTSSCVERMPTGALNMH